MFLRYVKLLLGLILFCISCYWAYQACIKVNTPPVGTRLQYRYGDDFKGNVEPMALTICTEFTSNYKFIHGKLLIFSLLGTVHY